MTGLAGRLLLVLSSCPGLDSAMLLDVPLCLSFPASTVTSPKAKLRSLGSTEILLFSSLQAHLGFFFFPFTPSYMVD